MLGQPVAELPRRKLGIKSELVGNAARMVLNKRGLPVVSTVTRALVGAAAAEAAANKSRVLRRRVTAVERRKICSCIVGLLSQIHSGGARVETPTCGVRPLAARGPRPNRGAASREGRSRNVG
jgi:hypothetical protein